MLVRVPRDEKVVFFLSFFAGGTTFSAMYSGSQSAFAGFSSMKIDSLCDLCNTVIASCSPPATASLFFIPLALKGMLEVTSFGVSLTTGLTASEDEPEIGCGVSYSGKVESIGASFVAGLALTGAVGDSFFGPPVGVCATLRSFDEPQPII